MNTEYALNDTVSINGRIVGINRELIDGTCTITSDIVVELENSRMRVLIKPVDINTLHKYQPIPETDSRKGE